MERKKWDQTGITTHTTPCDAVHEQNIDREIRIPFHSLSAPYSLRTMPCSDAPRALIHEMTSHSFHPISP